MRHFLFIFGSGQVRELILAAQVCVTVKQEAMHPSHALFRSLFSASSSYTLITLERRRREEKFHWALLHFVATHYGSWELCLFNPVFFCTETAVGHVQIIAADLYTGRVKFVMSTATPSHAWFLLLVTKVPHSSLLGHHPPALPYTTIIFGI